MDELLEINGASVRAAFEAVVHATVDGVLLLDAEGRVMFANRSAVRMFGSTGDQVVGSTLPRLTTAPGPDAWRLVIDRARAGEEVLVNDVALRRHDDLDVPSSVSVIGLLSADGRTTGYAAVLRDRTEEVVAQETLRSSEQRVRRMESLARIGSFVMDLAEDAVQWSPGMYDIFAVSPETFDGTRVAHLSLVHPDDRAAVSAMLDAAAARRVTSEADHRLSTGDGNGWVFTVVEPVLDSSGNVVAIRGICQDVTIRKDGEERLRAVLALEQTVSEELRRADQLKDEFLGTVSHELRTPLTSIIGFSSLLVKRRPEHLTELEPVLRNAREMHRMIEKLLDYSRLQAGKVLFEPRQLRLRDVVDACFDQYREQASQTLVNDVSAELEIVADRNALDRIFGNLVGNAVRYAGKDAHIRVTATLVPGQLDIDVADDGPGIPLEDQPHLFERFYRSPGASRRGTGIGLAIVREYAERHGGVVTCHSAFGSGATFRVSLPQPEQQREQPEPLPRARP